MPREFNWHIKRPQYGSRRLALKNHVVAAVGEYVGTTLFMLFALGATNIANLPTTSVTNSTTEGDAGSTVQTANTSNLLYIAFAFGFSLTVTAWCFARISGGLFNPAITLGMFLVGALSALRASILAFVQILGGITGAAIIDALTPGMSISRGLFLEAAMTALLMLVILLLAADKNASSFMAPLPIGLALFVAELASVYWTGGSLNWVGPGLGSCVAALFYRLIKYLERATAEGNAAENIAAKDSKTMNEKAQNVAQNGDEPVRPKGGVRVEGTGFAGGLHDTGHGSRPQTPITGPVHPELYSKIDRLESMMTTLLAQSDHGHAVGRRGTADTLSGDTIAHPPIGKVVSGNTESLRSSTHDPVPLDGLADHRARHLE
ncbi:hypothetical protein B0A53_00252 [Rhodotorula sp. CCFEE 5036]|nr:hypothetical protein B0A53_00252 [Rhodotorula sp. CCFEE 5036]